jgi:D-alanyl-D-alanine carboxypeptidase
MFYQWKSSQEDLYLAQIEFEQNIKFFQDELDALDIELDEVSIENQEMSDLLSEEQKKNLELEREQRDKEEEIEELTKLTTLDPELLKKYSKVYFLSENYVPEKLVDIDKEYLSNPLKIVQVSRDVWPYLEDLLKDALRDDVTILVASGYRSFETQKNLKDNYTVQYGAGTANTFSAEQGYSEHQLGTTFDFTTVALKGALSGFDTTPEYKWLQENAYKHGFIISYPKANTFYKYEPWHWRFVGQDLARYLYRQNKYFYQLDQRDIDEYLLEIFD